MSAEATDSRSEPGIRLVAGPELTMLEVRKEDAVRELASDHQVEFKFLAPLFRQGSTNKTTTMFCHEIYNLRSN